MATRHDGSRQQQSPDPAKLPGRNPYILVGTLVGAKIATIVVVLTIERTSGMGVMVAATTWYWIIVLGAVLATPVVLAVRLRRVRSRRAELLRGEWQVDGPAAAAEAAEAAEARRLRTRSSPLGGRDML